MIAHFIVGWSVVENSKVVLVCCDSVGVSICLPCPWHVVHASFLGCRRCMA